MMRNTNANVLLLKERLDALYRTYGGEYLGTDPLMFLHRYEDPEDIEVVGLVCSAFAYGQVKSIQSTLSRILEVMGKHPARYAREFDVRARARDFAGIKHRFNRPVDIVLLIYYIKQMFERSGSIGEFFRMGYTPDTPTIEGALYSFVEGVLSLDCTPVYPGGRLPKDARVRFFFPSPSSGSACKRLNLYLRWMVRRDGGLDFGLWDFVMPSQLVVPVDTHIARICTRIGLTSRRAAGWRMALEITESLKKLDAYDPVKYDFALCRLGILDKCPAVPQTRTCAACDIRCLCTHVRRT